MDRKKLKQNAKQTVRKHYLLLTMLALVAVLLGADFGWTGHVHQTADTMRYAERSEDNLLVYSHEGPSETIGEIVNDSGVVTLPEDSTALTITGQLIDTASAGSLWTTVLEGIHSLFKAVSGGAAALIVLATVIAALVSIFVIDVLKMVLRRIFLEARTYDAVPLRHAVHIAAVGRWGHAAIAYFRKEICLFLWSLTIVGGWIKHYSYLLVPYILAENPAMSGKDAILLSRKMMDGHKMEAFRLQLSMIGWDLLDLCSLGIAGILWTDVYTTAVWSEYYAELRAQAQEAKLPGAEQLNDVYLYAKADEETLNRAYRDIRLDERYCSMNAVELNGLQKFFATTFGIWFGSAKKLRLYQGVEDLQSQVDGSKAAVSGSLYPSRLSPLYRKQTSHLYGHLYSRRTYSIPSLLLLFTVCSFIAWGYMAVNGLILHGVTDTGFLHGPWLPLFGGILLACLLLLHGLQKHPVNVFIGSALIAGIIEFVTSLLLENSYGMRWWDYTGWLPDIAGRASVEAVLVLAVFSVLVIHLLAPVFDNWLSRKNQKAVLVISLLLLVLFCWDCAVSFSHPNESTAVKETAALIETEPSSEVS